MLYNLMLKLNLILGNKDKVEYKKGKLGTNSYLTYLIDPSSYEYGTVYIDLDDFQEYSFVMHNADGQRNVRCHYLTEEQIIELFTRAINKDLDLYNF